MVKNERKIYVASVGEEKRPVFYGLKHVRYVDKILLVHSNETKDVAYEIKDVFDELGIYETLLVEVDPRSIDDVIDELVKFVKKHSLINYEYVSNISGGTKPMSIGVYIFTSIMNGESFYVFKKSENEMEILDIPSLKIDIEGILGVRKRSKAKIRICKALIESPRTLSELSRSLGYSKTSIKFHLEFLENNGLIRKNKKIEITPLGKIAVSLYDYQKSLEKFIKNS